jgi:prolyl-tRNA editing enzyme YbaK/EbsC (Cys-tRNA(Pro) deacylase)
MQPAAVHDLQAKLDAVGAAYELLPHPRTTSAIAEAASLGVPPCEVAKTVILVASHGCVRAVVPADARVSVPDVRRVLQDDSARVAGEDELRRMYVEYELGAVPPLGGTRAELAIVDTSLIARPTIVIEAGRHDASLRVSPRDLVHVCGAWIADIRERERGPSVDAPSNGDDHTPES